MSDYVISARQVRKERFEAEPGPSRFLEVPDGALALPAHEVRRKDAWVRRVRRKATWGTDERTGNPRGDVVVFIHGYNNSAQMVMSRHRQLKRDLTSAGFKGLVVSFDWPSGDRTLNYVEDRHDAKQTAMQLVHDGIRALAQEQGPGCTINVHVVAHSMGAYVVREAFDDADDATLAQSGWLVSQMVFIGADVSSGSMALGDSSTDSLYRHCTRLTNYSNRADSVLKISNAKRLGMAPRVGRVGLPRSAPAMAVNVDCTEYFQSIELDPALRAAEQRIELGRLAHSWHIGNRIFAMDLFETLRGDRDREAIPTRRLDPQLGLVLQRPRPSA